MKVIDEELAKLSTLESVSVSQSMQQIWTTRAHNGPDHLGLWPLQASSEFNVTRNYLV